MNDQNFMRDIQREIEKKLETQCCSTGTFGEDETECERRLGQPPPAPSLSSDTSSIEDYDNYWIDKLTCIDETHSKRQSLEIKSIDRILTKLSRIVPSYQETNCKLPKSMVTDCYGKYKRRPIKCDRHVNEFVSCIDDMLYDVVRPDSDSTEKSEESTYEKFFKKRHSRL